MPPLDLLLQQALNGLMLGVMYALIAVGFTLFFGVLDVIHFSHGDIYMLGAFAGLTALGTAAAAGVGGGALALVLAFAAAIVVTGLIGVAAERLCVKPLARASPLMTLLATLSLGLVIREAVLIFYPRGADPNPFPRLLPQGGFEVGGVSIRYENLVILAIGLAAMVAVDLVITRTRMGAAIRAVAQDAEAAQMMGVDLDRTVDATFFLGSGLAAWLSKGRIVLLPTAIAAALLGLFAALGRTGPVPVVLPQHMPAAFTPSLAQHITRAGVLPCGEAADGEALLPGRI